MMAASVPVTRLNTNVREKVEPSVKGVAKVTYIDILSNKVEEVRPANLVIFLYGSLGPALITGVPLDPSCLHST